MASLGGQEGRAGGGEEGAGAACCAGTKPLQPLLLQGFQLRSPLGLQLQGAAGCPQILLDILGDSEASKDLREDELCFPHLSNPSLTVPGNTLLFTACQGWRDVLLAFPWAVIEPSMDFTVLKSLTKPLSAQPGDIPHSLHCWFLLLLLNPTCQGAMEKSSGPGTRRL